MNLSGHQSAAMGSDTWLTPEDKFEKDALKMFAEKPTHTTIVEGEFYHCQGGYVRHRDHPEVYRSLIMRIEERAEPQGER